MKKNTILLIDGNALLHRTFHALPPMVTRNGEHTNAVYGFLTILFKALSEIKPQFAVVTWDEGKKTFRHKEFVEYKAQRVRQADELYTQLKRTREILEAMGIPNFSSPDFEADDLIGTLSKQGKEKNLNVIILTGDLDSLQLVNDEVKVYTMRKGISDIVIYDKKAVEEKYGGLGPKQMIDYKALRGDASDNIPGLPGVGEKTATDLLVKYGSIDSILKNLDELSPKLQEIFNGNAESLKLNRRLVEIVLDAPVSLEIDKAKLKKYDREAVAKIFQELEFKSLLARLPFFASTDLESEGLFAKPQKEAKTTQIISLHYQIIEDLDSFVSDILKLEKVCFDTETDFLKGDLIGISFAWSPKEGSPFGREEGYAYYLPMVSCGGYIQKRPKKELIEKLKPVFQSNIKFIGQNLKYDYEIMKAYGIEVKNLSFDTMVASYVLHPHYNSHSLDSLAFTELGYETMTLSQLFDKGDGKKPKIDDLKTIQCQQLAQYSCEDADITLRLYNKFFKDLEAAPNLKKLFYQIDMPLVRVLSEMEIAGIKVDCDFMANLSEKMHKEIDSLTEEIYKMAGIKFNINSTTQLKEILFKRLKIDTKDIKKTKTGISTAASELEKLRGKHPMVDLLFRYRELTKLTSTYIDALPKLVDKVGRIHTSFNQTLTSTGRLSSTDPNLQNIPIRSEDGRLIRQAFIADEGSELISADYSQIELRVAASLSKDKEMIEAFRSRNDFHTLTAAEVAGIPIDKVTKEMRYSAKAINFGMIYGQSPHGLSNATGMTHEQAKDYIDKYFKLYSGLKKFLDQQIEEARENGLVETLFGRRRYIPEINSGVFAVRSGAERTALNTPIQGTAADILKMAMINAYNELIEGKYAGRAMLLLTVHDELVFEVKKADLKEFTKDIKDIMENVADIGVPLEAEVKIGMNWGEMKVFSVS